MITQKVGKFTVRYPLIGVIAVLLVTAGAIVAQQLWPMESSFSNEDFLPDINVAKANTLYQDAFSSAYPFMVLIRSPDGDLVTPDAFREMTMLQEDIKADDTYGNWSDPGSRNGISSPASGLYSMKRSVDFLEGLKASGPMYRNYLPISVALNRSADNLLDGLNDTEQADPTGEDGILDRLEQDLKTFLSTVIVPPSGDPPYTSQIEYYDQFNSDIDFKEEVSNLSHYDTENESIEEAIYDASMFTSLSEKTVSSISSAIDGIDRLLQDNGLNSTIKDRLTSIRNDLQESMQRLHALNVMASQQGNPLIKGQMSQSYGMGSFLLINFLTEDFEPASDEYSADGAMIYVELDYSLFDLQDTDKERLLEIEGNISSVVGDFDQRSDLIIHSLASARLSERIDQASSESMMILLPLAMLFILVILSFIYRSVIDIALNILALGMAIIWMYGFGSIMGYSSNPMITAVPVLLVGLGIDYGIHLTMRYREEIRKGRTVKESLTTMSASVGMALLLATFTTVFAFMSNVTSPVGLLMQFGVMAAVGILSSFVIMIVFVPSAKTIIDTWKARKGISLFRGIKEGECDLCDREKSNNRMINRVILKMSIGAEKHPITILSVVIVLSFIMTGFALQNEVTFDVNDFLPDGLQESRDLKYLFEEFRLGGSGESGIIIIEGDITDPKVLRAMDRTMDNVVDLDSDYFIMEGSNNNVRPNADFLLYSMKDMAGMLGAFDPENPFLINYSMYFDFDTGLPEEGTTSDQVKTVLDGFYHGFTSQARRVIHNNDGEYDLTAIAFTIDTYDDKEAWKLFDQLKEVIDPIEALEGGPVEAVSITGSTILIAVIIDSITSSQIQSLILTIVVSLVVLTIIFFIEERSYLLGAVATLPVATCVIWILGTMYLIGIPLNVMTITIGALTVGLGITYGIHITHRFIEDAKEEEDLHEASRNTMMNTGSALFGAALTTVGGFGLLVFATMPPLKQFGAVTALAIIYSFLSSVIVLPVLLIIWAKARKKVKRLKREKGMN